MIVSWILIMALAGGLLAAFAASLGAAEPAVPSLGAVVVVLAARRARRAHYRPLSIAVGMAEGITRPFGIFLLPIVFCLLGGLARATRGPLPTRAAPERFLLGAAAYALFLGIESLLFSLLGHALPPVFGTPWTWGVLAVVAAGGLQVCAEAALDKAPRLKRGIESIR